MQSDTSIKPLIRARKKEDRGSTKHLESMFAYDEKKIDGFTFRKRFTNNKLHGRNTSTLNASTALSIGGSLSLGKPKKHQLKKNLNLT